MKDNPMKSSEVYYVSDLPLRTSERPLLTRLCNLSRKDHYSMAMDFPKSKCASIIEEGLSPEQLQQRLDSLFENISLCDAAYSLSTVSDAVVFVAPMRGGAD